MATEKDTQDLNDQNAEQDILSEGAGFAESFGAPPAVTPAAETQEEQEPVEEEADTEEEQAESEAQADETDTEEEEVDEAEAARAELEQLLKELPSIGQKAQMTEQQLRQLNGKIGELNRTVSELRNSATKPSQLKLTKESFKKLAVDYPELAEQLADDLSQLTLNTQGQVPVDVEPIVQQRVAEATQEIQQKFAVQLLTMAHRDWKTVVNSESWKTWVAKLPPEEQTALNESWDPGFIADKIAAFKTADTKAAAEKAKRVSRLANAVLPKTQAAPKRVAMTEEDGFAAAFKT